MLTKNRESRVQFQKDIVQTQVWQTCLNCIHWGQNGYKTPRPEQAICTRYRMLPPPNVIVYGCQDWEGDIPF